MRATPELGAEHRRMQSDAPLPLVVTHIDRLLNGPQLRPGLDLLLS
jgi:hypothetical protein